MIEPVMIKMFQGKKPKSKKILIPLYKSHFKKENTFLNHLKKVFASYLTTVHPKQPKFSKIYFSKN
jgi:hypothetical protein